jgi:hypothetical protein
MDQELEKRFDEQGKRFEEHVRRMDGFVERMTSFSDIASQSLRQLTRIAGNHEESLRKLEG